MPHPEIDNQTPFTIEPVFVADENGRPVLAPIVRGTFDVDVAGNISIAAEQLPVTFTGEHYGEPGESSYKYEPETAFVKLGTDVVLLGHAHAPYVGATRVDVDFRVGPLAKTVRVWGNRHVTKTFTTGISDPAPFERIPLVFERAFGGWDRSPEDPNHHAFEPRNPVGVGFVSKRGTMFEGDPLPNLEDPSDPLPSAGRPCTPAGFGFVGPDWHPRTQFAGTYDEAWSQTRAPLLPADFDRRFFNAASEGLVSAGFLRGDEHVLVRGATPEGTWQLRLPAVSPPECLVVSHFAEDLTLASNLDTVIVDADARRVIMLWRCFTTLRNGPLDVQAVRVTCANLHPPRSTAQAPLRSV